MRSRGLATKIFLILSLVGIGGPGLEALAADISFETGLGYDYLSQAYFLDSIAVEGSDTVLADWELRSIYLNDLKTHLGVSWTPSAPGLMELRSSYEQTRDYLRLNLAADVRHKSGKNRFDASGELEWRDRFRGDNGFGDSYLRAYLRTKFRRQLTGSIAGVVQIRTENVSFRDLSEQSYDYHRIGAKFGLEKSFDNFSFAGLNLFVSTRRVPDSSSLTYLTTGIEGLFFGSLPTGELDLSLRLEEKTYSYSNEYDDYRRLELLARNRHQLGRDWLAKQEIDLEASLYRKESLVSLDYVRLGLALLAGIETGNLSLAIGPDLELLDEKQDGLTTGEDYLEAGLRVDLDYFDTGVVFGSIQSILGRRNLSFENDLQTNFTFQRLDLLAEIRIISVLNLSILGSAEWEWHSQGQGRTALYLISTGLTYSF
ncbi:MAG: hypothetical protein KOO62_00925 [candidate division Zixibacteria bacterium]|nr:hypothetical protein [candidate division Zixibacteria bacterium]